MEQCPNPIPVLEPMPMNVESLKTSQIISRSSIEPLSLNVMNPCLPRNPTAPFPSCLVTNSDRSLVSSRKMRVNGIMESMSMPFLIIPSVSSFHVWNFSTFSAVNSNDSVSRFPPSVFEVLEKKVGECNCIVMVLASSGNRS